MMQTYARKTAVVLGLLIALVFMLQVVVAPERKNPGPGDLYPEDFVYDISGGGQFRLADFKGKKAVLLANHIVDDGSTSWHADPFKRLKQLQAKYGDQLAIAVMPEHAHHRQQTPALWEATSRDVRELLNPGDLPILIENKGAGNKVGRANHSLYQALNPQNLYGWWPMVLIGKDGRIVWTNKNPQTGNSEHMVYETQLRPTVVQLVDPDGFRKWIAEVPQDWVQQASPWGVLEIEDFERYRDMGDLHVSSCWTNNAPLTTYKGELSIFPARTGHRALALFHSQRVGFAFGYPFYYGYRDPGYGIWAHHAFEGPPRTGTLVFFFASYNKAMKLNFSEHKGRGFAFQIEGLDGKKVYLRFGRIGQHPPPGPEDIIAGDIQTDVKWNLEEVWNRISFHVDPKAGTQIFLDKTFLAEVPHIKGITGILFQAGWTCSVDDIIMIPKNVSVDELDGVVRCVDEQRLDRPHVTPLERESEIIRLSADKKAYPLVLRINWGSSEPHTDAAGLIWHAGQPWLRGTYGALDGDDFVYPDDVRIEGSDAEIYRRVRYSAGRLRFTVPKGSYKLRVHFARPFHWRAGEGFPEDRVEMEIEPDGPGRDLWNVNVPYRKAVAFEKSGIQVTDGVLDLRFIFTSQVHIAATELIQESLFPGEKEGIPDWPSVSR